VAVADVDAWRHERDDVLRGVSGGMLVGVPLLYTMEVWWRGAELGPPVMALMVAITFVPVVGLIATSGFRRVRDRRVIDVALDSVDAVALAAVCVVLSVLVVGAVRLDDPLSLTIGTLITELAPFAIGVALASVVLAGGSDDEQDDDSESQADPQPDPQPDDHQLNRTVADVGGAVVGAVVVGLSIAPTDEVPLVASSLGPAGLLVMVAFSLVASYVIVFEAGFGDQRGRRSHAGLFQQPITETVVSYLLALVVGTVMLVFFGRISLDDPARLMLDHAVVLGLPACIGAAAGRLAV
jgi:putative integral membrane protein (TIGR02587 family)